MKKTTILTCLLPVILLTVLQAQQNNPDYLRTKINKFNRMKKIGSIMLVAGSVSAAGGIVLLANTDWEKTSGGNGGVNYNANDGSAIWGMLLTGVGIGLVGGGIPLTLIGHNKVKKYKGQFLELTLVPIIDSHFTGAQLSLRL